MKNKESDSWSLFRLSDRAQFDHLNLSTVEFFYRALPPAIYPDWLMWRDGFSEWRPFSELPLLLKHLERQREFLQPPPVPASVLKLADAMTSSRLLLADPQSIVGEAKFELPKNEESLALKDIGDRSNLNHEVSSPSEVKNKTIPSLSSAENLEQLTRSAASTLSLQGEAKSNLRLQTTPGFIAGGAAASQMKPLHRKSEDIDVQKVIAARSRPNTNDAQSPEVPVLTLSDESTLSLMLESEAATEDRNNVRYQKRYRLRIFTAKGIITVTTVDCSISGFKLKDPLPEGLPRFFHVEIDLGPEGKIPLICSEVKEKDGRPATRIRIQVNDNIQIYKSALMRAS
jgi:hypothetical protein